MRSLTVAILIPQLLSTYMRSRGGDIVEIFGLRIGRSTTVVKRGHPVFLTVFGINLPSGGYYLSTTDRCEDSDNADILVKAKVPLQTTTVYENAVSLTTSESIPFSQKHKTFQLCNKGSTSLNKVLLQLMEEDDDSYVPLWLILLVCAITLLISAYCSGANFAYMRMSINDVVLIMENGDEPHKTHARKIFKIRKQSNWLICTMATMNIVVNAIFTATLVILIKGVRYEQVLQYAIPTILIVVLAEILPQSICNRSGLMLAAKTRHITIFLFIICAPIAWPLSKVVDFLLGREAREIYSEEKLKALIKVQSKKMEEAAQGDILARIADFPKKTVQDMMTPMEDTFMVSSSERLDVKLLVSILEKGYTRIPVYEEKNRLNLSAVLNVKDLATMSVDHRSTVQQFMNTIDAARTQMRFVLATQRGEAVMQEMMKGDHHLCAVIRFSYGRYRVVGLITFEDVIEEVFGDIEDDSDKMWNNRRAGVHKDQQSLDWFRSAENEQPTGLGVNATLRLIQSIFDICPSLATLGYNVLRMKGLLSVEHLRHAEEDELIEPRYDRNGTITVSNKKTRTYRLDANRAEFKPYIWGKSLVSLIVKERLQVMHCLGENVILRSFTKHDKIRVITRASYFELSYAAILNGLLEPEDVGYEYNMMLATPPSETDEFGDKRATAHPRDLESTQSSASHAANVTPKKFKGELFNFALTPRRLRNQLLKLRPQTDYNVSGESTNESLEFPSLQTSQSSAIGIQPSVEKRPKQGPSKLNVGETKAGTGKKSAVKHMVGQALRLPRKASRSDGRSRDRKEPNKKSKQAQESTQQE
ncbi:hypothetical protein Q1695_011923 [Nippostrongylus brasiliensis]|nr:hypothetical protein Q1695_011923 [Nippostrongylus brasiliensis]